MKNLRSASFLMALCFVAACKVGNGDFSGFDSGSGFDHDASTSNLHDAARPKDASAAHQDAGYEAVDAARPDGGSAFTAAAATNILAQGVCTALRECMSPDQLIAYQGAADCQSFVARQQADGELHWLADAVAAKRVVLTSSAAPRCQTDLQAYGCNVNSHRMPGSCKELITGQVALDGACSIDQECSGSTYCDKGASTETCPGACVAFQTSGLPCRASRECADGLECRDCTDAKVCSGKACLALLKQGDACETLNGQPTCPAGLICKGKPGSGTCETRSSVFVGKLGDACDVYGALCQVGLVCESTTGTAGKCAALASAGDACKRAKPSQCPNDQYCDAVNPGVAGVCQFLPTDGQACVRKTCAPDNVCIAASASDTIGTCHALTKAGAACVASAQCYSGTCDTNICVTPISCQL